jgi:zinc protease
VPGRTGLAHLFEHLMFMGSGHVPHGQFDELLEKVGGRNNATTSADRTDYFETVPSNALELPLYLNSDRLGYLLDTMTPAVVNGQRDVVKNEMRQSYLNRPYGRASMNLADMLYPVGHPYHWTTIGSMDDLTAASYDDIVAFFKKYYGPNNASLAIVGDIDPVKTRALVEKWFGDLKPIAKVAPVKPPLAELTEVKRRTITDKVQLPRLYLAWLSPPLLSPGDADLDLVAAVLTGGKNSRLYQRLVYQHPICQSVQAYQESGALSSCFNIVVTPRPGHTLAEVQAIVDEEIEKLKADPPTPHELERAINTHETELYQSMEGIDGKAAVLNEYYTMTGNPDYFSQDLERYRRLTVHDVQAAAKRYLPAGRRVELSIVPENTRNQRANLGMNN